MIYLISHIKMNIDRYNILFVMIDFGELYNLTELYSKHSNYNIFKEIHCIFIKDFIKIYVIF